MLERLCGFLMAGLLEEGHFALLGNAPLHLQQKILTVSTWIVRSHLNEDHGNGRKVIKVLASGRPEATAG